MKADAPVLDVTVSKATPKTASCMRRGGEEEEEEEEEEENYQGVCRTSSHPGCPLPAQSSTSQAAVVDAE